MYKIEIWQHSAIADEFASDSLDEVKNWYIENWLECYNDGDCYFHIIGNGVFWDFNKKWDAGFLTC